MRCGCLGLLQWLQVLSPGVLSFQWVRRFLPRVLECRRLGTAMDELLLGNDQALSVRGATGGPGFTGARTLIEIRAAAGTQPPALFAAARRHRQLEQQRLPGLLADIEAPSIVKLHVVAALELFLVGTGNGSRTFGEQLEWSLEIQLETVQTADALGAGGRVNASAHRDPVAVPHDVHLTGDAVRPLVGRQAQIPGRRSDPDMARFPGERPQ